MTLFRFSYVPDSLAIQINFCFLQGRHALVYDINTANETWEWVDLKEVSLYFLYM